MTQISLPDTATGAPSGDAGAQPPADHSAAPAPGEQARTAPEHVVAPIAVRRLTRTEHAAAVADARVSFLQLPEWADVKPGWRPEGLGWFGADGALLGTALVLHRDVPGTPRSLAYLPEGPDLPWRAVAADPVAWLGPMVAHLRRGGAFAVRMGPRVPVRRWRAATAKAGLAADGITRFADLPADETDRQGTALLAALQRHGWHRPGGGNGFGSGQPRFAVEIPLAGRDATAVAGDLNTQWRRALKAAGNAGVTCREGSREDLATFARLYRETAARDGFTPRPDAYFTLMWDALNRNTVRLRLFLAQAPDAELPGGVDTLAAALTVDVADRRWYSYGASTSRRRRDQASTALQWHLITDAIERGRAVQDLRGIGDTLDPEHHLAGLVRFKLGTGGDVVEYAGEWELVLRRPTHLAVQAAQAAAPRARLALGRLRRAS